MADIEQLIDASIAPGDLAADANVARLLDAIHARHGDAVQAVLMYGSYLRGKRDTVLDFYVLFDELRPALPSAWQAAANRLLPPNVYYLHLDNGDLRAKYATLRLDQFEHANAEDFHCYFWARFTQPCRLVYCRDAAVRGRVVAAIGAAARTFARRVVPMLPARFDAPDLWRTGFALTYAAELRSERGDNIAALYDSNAAHLDALTHLLAAEGESALTERGPGQFASRAPVTRARRRRAAIGWVIRRWQGKWLSVLRLVKAAGTFNDALDYLLWKIERHSGIYIAPSERQRRYPLLFAWPLLWRLYRRGAFR
ncbi:MAG: hypothetical protein R3E86_09025 [Pseudomonadales bacterium]